MASQAKRAFLVQRQEFDIVGMTEAGSVAAFAFDAPVWPEPVSPYIGIVALGTGTRRLALVLDGEVFPLLDITETVVVVGETLAMHTEVVGNEELPGKKNESQ